MLTERILAALGVHTVLGRILRWFANLYVDGSIVTIKTGVAGGYRWRRYHRYVNGYWIGHYELPLQEAMRRELGAGMTFFDIGAHAGFFALVGSRLVGESGRCVAFEPSEVNIGSINDQIELNHLGWCQAVKLAIADHEGRASYCSAAAGSSEGHLGQRRLGEQEVVVDIATIDRVCSLFGKPDLIKMDIEGGEVAALRGARETLRHVRPRLLVELHGPEAELEVRGILRDAGYRVYDLNGGLVPDSEAMPHHFLAKTPVLTPPDSTTPDAAGECPY